MATTTIYKIHPAIGIARVGNSDDFYVGPTEPGGLPTDLNSGNSVTSFRDANGNLLRQAAQFTVYAYEIDEATGKVGTVHPVKVGENGVDAISWTVHLASKKAAWYQFKQLRGSGMDGDPGYTDTSPLRQNSQFHINDKDRTDDRNQLILDPGPQTVTTNKAGDTQNVELDLPKSSPYFKYPTEPYTIQSLGTLQSQNDGQLLVVGGYGKSGTTNLNPRAQDGQAYFEYALITYPNNDGWFDDVADGPVTATITLNGTPVEVDVPAWCLSVPPKYAPQVFNQVTLYDTMYDVFVRHFNYRPDIFSNGAWNTNYKVSVFDEIAPILARPDLYRWVAEIPVRGVTQHEVIALVGPSPPFPAGGPYADFPFERVRPAQDKYYFGAPPDPGKQPQNNGSELMPKLAGDNPFAGNVLTKTDGTGDTVVNDPQPISKYLTLAPTQYFLLKQWKGGNFGGQVLPLSAGEQLDKAALENCVGGAFCPGIEVTWISRNPAIYHNPSDVHDSAFRIRHKSGSGPLDWKNGDDNKYANGLEAGDLTKYMAQPWQADFNQCSNQPVLDSPIANNPIPYPGLDVVTFWWWPAQRPFFVYPTENADQQLPWTRGYYADVSGTADFQHPNLGDMQMVVNWKHLGFILNDTSLKKYVEVERNTKAIEEYVPPYLHNQPDSPPERIVTGRETAPAKKE